MGTVARKHRGNMLLLCAMVAMIILVILLVFFSIQFAFFAQKRLQTQADELALNMARRLNDNDCAGLLNHLTAYSREGVFTSRNTYSQICQRAPQLETLARQLLNDARQGAMAVRHEREKLTVYEISELKKMLQEESRKPAQGLSLPWASAEAPVILEASFGEIKDVQSNALAPLGNDPLLEYDRGQGFIQAKTDLYFAAKPIHLPPPDSDLSFVFSSLAAPVKGTISPPRLTGPQVFKKTGELITGGKQKESRPPLAPSAVSVKLSSQVKVAVGNNSKENVQGTSTAAACGAGAPPN